VVAVDYLHLYVAFMHITIGMTIDREVIWSSYKDGALMIVAPWWNANLGYILPRQFPMYNPYYSAL
jgi:hypothetical protein